MKRKIDKALPGFVGVREFFRRLGTSFEPVRLGDDEAKRMRAKIMTIRGTPKDCVESAVRAWTASARVLEARRYPGDATVVRFGVREVNCTTLALGGRERQLLVAFDGDERVMFYSLVDERGRMEELELKVSNESFVAENADLDCWQLVEKYIGEMKYDEVFILSDKKGIGNYFQVLAGPDEKDGSRLYYVEYCLVDFAWHFCTAKHVTAGELVRLVRVLRDGGFLALQDATEWRQMDAARYWKKYKRAVCVDKWLAATCMAADSLERNAMAERCRKALARKTPGGKALSVMVEQGPWKDVVEQISTMSKSTSKFTAAERVRLAAFAELAK